MDFSNLTNTQLIDTYMHLMYTRYDSSFTETEWTELVDTAWKELVKRSIVIKEEDY